MCAADDPKPETGPQYRPGQRVQCPHCGRDSVVKLERQMQGWTCVGQHLACAFCHASLGPAITGSPESRARQKSAEGRSKAASLFGEAVPTKPANPLTSDPGDKATFCRDCRHFLKHPFVCRCLLHDRGVEPMDDCPDFDRARTAEPDAKKPTE